jgi:hypothetical protein
MTSSDQVTTHTLSSDQDKPTRSQGRPHLPPLAGSGEFQLSTVQSLEAEADAAAVALFGRRGRRRNLINGEQKGKQRQQLQHQKQTGVVERWLSRHGGVSKAVLNKKRVDKEKDQKEAETIVPQQEQPEQKKIPPSLRLSSPTTTTTTSVSSPSTPPSDFLLLRTHAWKVFDSARVENAARWGLEQVGGGRSVVGGGWMTGAGGY